MSSPVVPRAQPWRVRVPLAKDGPRLAVLVGLRVAIGAIGLYTGIRSQGSIGITVSVASVVVLAYSVVLLLYVLSVRVEIVPTEVHLVSALRRRRYRLVPGPLTRMTPRSGRGLFGTHLGGLGVEIGESSKDEHGDVRVVRLAPGVPLILVPTAGQAWLAIAPFDQQQLVEALIEATRVHKG